MLCTIRPHGIGWIEWGDWKGLVESAGVWKRFSFNCSIDFKVWRKILCEKLLDVWISVCFIALILFIVCYSATACIWLVCTIDLIHYLCFLLELMVRQRLMERLFSVIFAEKCIRSVLPFAFFLSTPWCFVLGTNSILNQQMNGTNEKVCLFCWQNEIAIISQSLLWWENLLVVWTFSVQLLRYFGDFASFLYLCLYFSGCRKCWQF